jgi:DNA mismatch repair ATPase MutS
MSGKSTLLRAIGLNAVLALAGGPVCARRMTLPVLDIWTSIRVEDSLAEGVSLFMAELQRLKAIVDAARDVQRRRPMLYLLDEMLHGTNTAERQVAARTILGHLIHSGTIGAVTTHDLTLAADGALAGAAVDVHFTESFARTAEGERMTFDYKLRPGLATSSNAIRLLEMLGLAAGGDAGAPTRSP